MQTPRLLRPDQGPGSGQESDDRNLGGQKTGREGCPFEEHPGEKEDRSHEPSVAGPNARVARRIEILYRVCVTEGAT
jgi:hypothetical protein